MLETSNHASCGLYPLEVEVVVACRQRSLDRTLWLFPGQSSVFLTFLPSLSPRTRCSRRKTWSCRSRPRASNRHLLCLCRDCPTFRSDRWQLSNQIPRHTHASWWRSPLEPARQLERRRVDPSSRSLFRLFQTYRRLLRHGLCRTYRTSLFPWLCRLFRSLCVSGRTHSPCHHSHCHSHHHSCRHSRRRHSHRRAPGAASSRAAPRPRPGRR
mmetsp:Transcript_41772/g.90517  ORF Transcript_41772/g.90517 Transcript_41772/m.90517 type:complete len:212 (+) Transcript_41772:59-694(+)